MKSYDDYFEYPEIRDSTWEGSTRHLNLEAMFKDLVSEINDLKKRVEVLERSK